MSKAVLLSIKPNWCVDIVNLVKYNELRKTKPSIDTPFKVFIYCTKTTKAKDLCFIHLHDPERGYLANNRVIGEFICDRIDKYESEFCNNDCYEDIRRIFLDEDGEEDFEKIWDNESGDHENFVFPHSCVSYQELKKYIGIGFKTFYAWHISELKIYDKPKELSGFRHYCKRLKEKRCVGCEYLKEYKDLWCEYYRVTCNNKITRPPQSWCYVEDEE